MNPYSESRFIGFVTMVSPLQTRVHFPSSVLLKKFFNADNGYHAIAGKYIIIEGTGCGFLGKIIEIALPEKERLELTESKYEKEVFHPTGKVEILLCFDNYKLQAKKGLDQLPPVSAKVYLCSDDFLGSLLSKFGVKDGIIPKTIPLASLPDNENHKIDVSSQALFGRHCAVVGTTGGGKSWTVAKLIEEVVAQNGKAILIDATGEYETLSLGNKKIKYLSFVEGTNPTYFSYKSMQESDLIAMFRPAGQVQLPKFQDAIKSLRLRELILNDTSNIKDEQIIKDLLLYTDIGGSTKCFSKQHRERNTFSIAFEKYPQVNNQDCNFDINHLNRQISLECVYEYPAQFEMNNISPIRAK